MDGGGGGGGEGGAYIAYIPYPIASYNTNGYIKMNIHVLLCDHTYHAGHNIIPYPEFMLFSTEKSPHQGFNLYMT